MGDRNSRLSSGVAGGAVAVSLALSGCATGVRMKADSPIEKRTAFLGTRYEQDGKAVDHRDMLRKLKQDPEAADKLADAHTFGTFSVILVAVGTVFLALPVQAAAFDGISMPWQAALFGGVPFALSIPCGIVASDKLDGAVDAHNRRFQEPADSSRLHRGPFSAEPTVGQVADDTENDL